MRFTALCIVNDADITEKILADLNRSGFTPQEISVVTAPRAPAPDQEAVLEPQSRRTVTQQALGNCSLVGAALGLIATLSDVSIPGIGMAQGSGHLVAMLDGAGATGIGDALGACGVSQSKIHQYVAHLTPGHALISVNTTNGFEMDTLLEIFRDAGATLCERVVDRHAVEDQINPVVASHSQVDSRRSVIADRVREMASTINASHLIDAHAGVAHES